MKKITTAALFTLLLFQSKAQTLSVNYIKEFVSDSKSYFTNNNFAPYEVSGIVITYSQALQKLPLAVNISAARKPRRPPPWIIKYPDPPVFGKYAADHNIEADSASFSSSKSSSIDVLAGVGYFLPHKENSKFFISLNADFGVAFNDNTAVNFYRQRKLTGTAAQKKTELIINPSVQAKYFFSKTIGLNLIAGYNNRGGVNAGVGVVCRFKGGPPYIIGTDGKPHGLGK
jgi:hypothetical protein